MTQEGPAAYREVIEYLKSAKPITKPLAWSQELANACRDHCNDTGPKGITGHDGTDGS